MEIESLIELIRRASIDLPADVESALRDARTHEPPGSPAAGTLDAILENVTLARANATPIWQDTGTPIFFVHHPRQLSTLDLRAQIEAAVAEATRVSTLRPNTVDPRQRASAIRRTRAPSQRRRHAPIAAKNRQRLVPATGRKTDSVP